MNRSTLLTFLACPLSLLAWGSEGHRLIARIADAQLTEITRARVAAILGPNRTLVSVATWADDVRREDAGTAPWHFVNIPIIAAHLNMSRDCPGNNCVVAKIAQLQKALQDPATLPGARAEALMFLVHFIGDIHQPLHCGDNHDRGGNEVQVELAGRPRNLHSAWDSGILGRMGTEDQLFPAYSQESMKRAKKFRKGTASDWAEEGHKISKSMVYRLLPKAAPTTRPNLDGAYERSAAPIIRKQIERAGARWAWVLNERLR